MNEVLSGSFGAWPQFSGLLEAGGPVILVLLGMSVVAQAIVVLKLWQFVAIRIGSHSFIAEAVELWREGRNDDALQVLRFSRNPTARLMEIAIQGQLDPQVPETIVREEVSRVGSGVLETLRGYLRGLEVIGNLSPLLGLLGTVLGMIEAFRQLELAGSRVDPGILSGGIWEALLTTAAGLVVAILALLPLHWLEGTIDRFRHRMEDGVTQVFTRSPAVAQRSENSPVPPTPALEDVPNAT